MKRTLALLLSLILAVGLTAPAAALTADEASGLFSLDPGEDYTVLNRTNLRRNSEFVERLGYTVSAFQKAMEEGDVFLYAATADNVRQVQVKCWAGQEDVAQKIEDLAFLPEDKRNLAREEIGRQVAGEGELLSAETVERDGQIFFRFRVRSDVALESDEAAIGYCFDEYLTIADGHFCALLFYNAASVFSAADEAESARLFEAFRVAPTPEKTDWRNFALRIFAALLLIAAAITAVYLLSTFVRDIRLRREQSDTIPDRIKMRRK